MTSFGAAAATPRGPAAPPAREVVLERTRDALSVLARRARRARRHKISSWAYGLYAVAMVLLIYGSPLIVATAKSISGNRAGALHPAQDLAVVAFTTAAAAACAWALLAWDAGWRGPVGLSRPDVSWLLPLPIDRPSLLMPKFWSSVVTASVAGMVAGLLAGVGLLDGGLGHVAPDLVAPALAGLCLGALMVVAASLIQSSRSPARAAGRAMAVLLTASVLLAAAGILEGRGAALGWAGIVLLWSGPWGWAGIVVSSAAGAPLAGWPAAAALLAAAPVAVAIMARRRVPALGIEALAARADASGSAAAGLFVADIRQAYLSTGTKRKRRRARLPMPRYPWAAVLWRDALALLRAPGRLWAAGFAIGVGLVALLGFPTSVASLTVALVATYLGAAQLQEPARLESDDPKRSLLLRYSARDLALRHGALGLAVLLPIGAGAGAVAAGLHGCLAGAAAAAVIAPAALVGAYKGAPPARLSMAGMGGMASPAGDLGPVLLVAWYLKAPVLGLALSLGLAWTALSPQRWQDTIPLAAMASYGLLRMAGRSATKARQQSG